VQPLEYLDGVPCTSKTVATITWPDMANDDWARAEVTCGSWTVRLYRRDVSSKGFPFRMDILHTGPSFSCSGLAPSEAFHPMEDDYLRTDDGTNVLLDNGDQTTLVLLLDLVRHIFNMLSSVHAKPHRQQRSLLAELHCRRN
jgi:hypothetical protein